MNNTIKQKTKISCDKVCWILDILERLKTISSLKFPSVSCLTEMAKYSALYELMEILNLEFEDEAAIHNATPLQVKRVPEDISKSEDKGGENEQRTQS